LSKVGRETSTTGAQRREAVAAPEADLAMILDAWENLPKLGRRAIVVLVEAFQSFPSCSPPSPPDVEIVDL